LPPSPGPAQTRGEALTANQILERGAQQLQTHPSADASVDAAVAVEIGRVYISLRAPKLHKSLLSLAGHHIAAVPSTSALPVRLLLLRGWVNYLSADYAAAEKD